MLRPLDASPALHPHASPVDTLDTAAETDTTLAQLVRRSLTDLARHSSGYARLFAERAGVRLAYHVQAGQIDQLSDEGREALRSVYLAMQVALTIEPGLNTNELRKHLVKRNAPTPH
ncbi:hypothetical protein [Nocardioides mesophilus]|uniref:Uncharacterized protein n=1 Tax=Nocardioides mesophilus TaxID=433659 RepID=A0A7G9REI4_9ACTN|nr:hypothetical protein [Nocardioides mesophilus]QNN54009.1 hypothetical protein H9L09_06415 [Nocardioides mesophilus]